MSKQAPSGCPRQPLLHRDMERERPPHKAAVFALAGNREKRTAARVGGGRESVLCRESASVFRQYARELDRDQLGK